MEEFLDQLYEFEFDLINHLREFIGPKMEAPLMFISDNFGPHLLYTYALPFAAGFDAYLLSKLMVVLSMLNLVGGLAKILVPADRPYWWAIRKEKEITQSRITCESTGGFPSGHALSFSAFWYTIISYYYPDMKPTSIVLCMLPLLGVIATCRMYFYCHFLHQVVAGCSLGILFTIWYNQEHIEDYVLNVTPMESLTVYSAIALGSILIYMLILKFGTDPTWTVQQALDVCEDSSWVKVDQTPLIILAKDLGALAGIALSSPLFEKVESDLDRYKSVPLAIFVYALNIFSNSQLPPPTEKGAYYSCGFLKQMLYTYSLINIIPRISMLEKPCPCNRN